MWSKIKYLQALLSIPGLKLPCPRILITTDLDQPSFDSYTRKLIEVLSLYRIPLTIFSPNEPKGNEGYAELKELIEFARKKEVAIEIGSHSVRHESLANKELGEIVSTIKESLNLFRNEDIRVHGFRAPYLSIEGTYNNILKKLDKDVLRYDSSVLFEGNLFYSRLHDLFHRKCPHKIGNVWELPISCLDDYNLFNRLKQTDEFVSAYWKRKVDINIRHHNYFLLLIHPIIMANHFQALEDFLTYCTKEYSSTCFTTCLELVKELDRVQNEDM